MIKLNEKAIAHIRDNRALKRAILNTLDCSERVLYRDLAQNSDRLTRLSVIDLIVTHTNLPLSELIEGGKVSKLLAR